MDELISRQAAIEAINGATNDSIAEQQAIDILCDLALLPVADVVEVVRCGQCEWWKCNPNSEEYGICKKVSYDDFEVVMDSDDFCSYGEREEE